MPNTNMRPHQAHCWPWAASRIIIGMWASTNVARPPLIKQLWNSRRAKVLPMSVWNVPGVTPPAEVTAKVVS